MKPPGAEVDLLGPRLERIPEPADDRNVGDEIFGDPRAAPGAGGGVEITAALIKNKRVQEIDTRWVCIPTPVRGGPTSSSRVKPPSSFLRATD